MRSNPRSWLGVGFRVKVGSRVQGMWEVAKIWNGMKSQCKIKVLSRVPCRARSWDLMSLSNITYDA
ncbi:hypothetical protein H5410_026668 [Solanum commersonii]|uniref:Uncharacterized protein n=1 Tax=Solanum commersonii TaxID=4109 RepID=A0A9J5YZH8_SOLCO|nr:hypothetical protein H5410_026668 [Solanum commersonii]